MTTAETIQLNGKTNRHQMPRPEPGHRGAEQRRDAAREKERDAEGPQHVDQRRCLSVAPLKANTTASGRERRCRPGSAASTGQVASSLVASDAAEPLRSSESSRSRARSAPSAPGPRPAHPRSGDRSSSRAFSAVAEAAVSFGEAEQQLALWVIAERAEVRRLHGQRRARNRRPPFRAAAAPSPAACCGSPAAASRRAEFARRRCPARARRPCPSRACRAATIRRRSSCRLSGTPCPALNARPDAVPDQRLGVVRR